MSDLLWEKVDTDEECIPKLKQEEPYSDGGSFDSGENDSFSASKNECTLKDGFRNNPLRVRTRATKLKKCSYNDNPQKSNAKNVRKTKIKHRQSRNIDRKSNSREGINQYVRVQKSRYASDRENHNKSTVESVERFIGSPSKKRCRKKKEDVVNELLTRQLSIMWCLKEFEAKPCDTLGATANHKANVLGQVIRQGKDIYFQPTNSAISETSEDGSSTSRDHTRDKNKSCKVSIQNDAGTVENLHRPSEIEDGEIESSGLESGEIESDTTSNTVDKTNSHVHPKKKKKAKKAKRKLTSEKYQTSFYRGNLRKPHTMSKRATRSSHRHSRTRLLSSNKISRGKSQSSCTIKCHNETFFDGDFRVTKRIHDHCIGSQPPPREKDRSRAKTRSVHSRGGNR